MFCAARKNVDGFLFSMLLFLAGNSLLFGQQAANAYAGPPERPPQYVLGPDDQIKITVLGVPELTDKTVRIEPNGAIDLPLAGKVIASGLTVDAFQTKLEQQLSKDILHPQVSVEIADFGSEPISVMGAVNHPGVHQLRGQKTLAEALSLADGLRPDAGPRVTITRQIRYGRIPLRTAWPDPTGQFSVAHVNIKDLMAGTNPADNIAIFPHDVISVPTADVIFVIGDVKKPGQITMRDQSTVSVLQALSSAQGLGPQPAPQNSKIIRVMRGTNERREIPVDLRKVLEGKAEDIGMRPNDILVVPASGGKKAAARALEAAIETVTGVIIWRRP